MVEVDYPNKSPLPHHLNTIHPPFLHWVLIRSWLRSYFSCLLTKYLIHEKHPSNHLPFDTIIILNRAGFMWLRVCHFYVNSYWYVWGNKIVEAQGISFKTKRGKSYEHIWGWNKNEVTLLPSNRNNTLEHSRITGMQIWSS